MQLKTIKFLTNFYFFATPFDKLLDTTIDFLKANVVGA